MIVSARYIVWLYLFHIEKYLNHLILRVSSTTIYNESQQQRQSQIVSIQSMGKKENHHFILPPKETLASIRYKQGSQKYNRTAIIHVGPHKTGTSSIQGSMKVLITYLLEDNIELPLVPHNDPTQETTTLIQMGNIRNCFCSSCSTIKEKNLTCNMDQVQLIREISKRGSHVLISAETLSYRTTDVGAIKSFLTPLYENVIVIAFYRRFYDWLYSQWNENNKNRPVNKRITFSEWMPDIPTIQKKFERNHYTFSTVLRWQQYFGNDSVRVYNMHDTTLGTVIEQFFCNAISFAQTACKFVRQVQATKGVTVYNKSRNFIYEELAFYATQLGYIKPNVVKKYNLTQLTAMVRNEKNESSIVGAIPISLETVSATTRNGTKIGIHCLDEKRLQFLYNKTIEAEQTFFPKYYEQIGKNEIDQQFRRDRSIKFCHWNATELLLSDDTKWKHFFQNLT